VIAFAVGSLDLIIFIPNTLQGQHGEEESMPM